MRLNSAGTNMSPEQYRVLSSCQKVWRRNVFWSFLYLQSKLFCCPNTAVIGDDLLDLSGEYGTLLAQYYGYEPGRLFSKNIYRHFEFYILYIDSLAGGKPEEADTALKQWQENSFLLVDQLSELNPNWRELEWRGMLTQEMQILQDAAQRSLAGDFEDLRFSVDIYDNIAAEIADYMAVGMIRQFSIQ